MATAKKTAASSTAKKAAPTRKPAASKTAASSKANPFAKLKDAAAAETSEALHAAADVEETGADEETEDEVAAAKARLAAKRAARAKAAPEPEPEEEDGDADSEEDDEAEVDDDTPAALADDSEPDAEDADEEPEVEPAPKVKRSTRRTAAQVEREAAEREARLQEQIDALKAQVDGKADASEITVLQDRVVLEDGVGGDVRVVGNGRSLVNDDWRCTVDGLALLLGRSSSQATQQFKLPLSLVASLAELLSNVDEITE